MTTRWPTEHLAFGEARPTSSARAFCRWHSPLAPDRPVPAGPAALRLRWRTFTGHVKAPRDVTGLGDSPNANQRVELPQLWTESPRVCEPPA